MFLVFLHGQVSNEFDIVTSDCGSLKKRKCNSLVAIFQYFCVREIIFEVSLSFPIPVICCQCSNDWVIFGEDCS